MRSAWVSLSDELCRSYLDLRWHLDPAAATAAGVAALDGRLGHFDEVAVGEHLAALRAIEAGVEELEIEDTADELDRTVLLDEVRATIFRLQFEQPHRRNPVFWLRHLGDALHGLLPECDDRASAPVEPALGRLRAVPGFLRDARSTLREPAAPLLDIARELATPCRLLVRELAAALGAAAGEARADLEAAADEAVESLNEFAVALDTDFRAHADEHPPGIGAEEFERLLHHAHAIREGASELWRSVLHAEDDVIAELEALGAPGWRKTVAFRLADATEADPVATFQAELEQIAGFVAGIGLLPDQCGTPPVESLPAYLRPLTGYAHYRGAIASGTPAEARIWIAPDPSVAAWASQLAAEFGIPGQHAMAESAARASSEVRRRLGAWVSRGGWGLYAVDLLDDAGYWPDPEDRIMTRAHLLLRMLLARVDIGIHTRQLLPEEAEQLLTNAVPLHPARARALVRECLLEPTRAIGTLVGRRELLRLRAERRPRGGRERPVAEHHADVLAFGGTPSSLIRWGLGMEE